MPRRKTISVERLVDLGNTYLATSTVEPGVRLGVASMLEQVLHETGNYRGFRCLRDTEVPAGQLPGIQTGPNGELLPYEERFVNTDDSRRQYS